MVHIVEVLLEVLRALPRLLELHRRHSRDRVLQLRVDHAPPDLALTGLRDHLSAILLVADSTKLRCTL